MNTQAQKEYIQLKKKYYEPPTHMHNNATQFESCKCFWNVFENH